MKFSFILVLLILAVLPAKSINDIKKLKETINCFGEVFMSSETKLPVEFTLSLDEFKNSQIVSNKNLTESDVLKKYEELMIYSANSYKKLKNKYPYVSEIVTFDTIAYKSGKFSILNISIVFKNKTQNAGSFSYETFGTLFEFKIINNKLKFEYCQPANYNDLYSDTPIMEIAKRNGFSALCSLTSENEFMSSEFNAVPIRKKDKWGLVSLSGSPLLPIIYDTIKPFYKGYSRVVINGQHNLIDEKFNLVFDENKFHIKLRDDNYYVAEKKGEYRVFIDPNVIKKTSLVELDETNEEDFVIAEVEKNEMVIVKSYFDRPRLGWNLNIQRCREANVNIITEGNNNLNNSSYYVISKANGDTLSKHFGFESIAIFCEFLMGRRNDSTIIMDLAGNVNFKSNYYCRREEWGYLLVYDKSKRLFGLYCPYTKQYVKPKYRFIEAIDIDKFFIVVTKNGKMGYLDNAGKELFD